MEISEDLRSVFSANVEEQNGSYVIEVPKREVDLGSIHEGAVYRVAVLDGTTATTTRDSTDESSADAPGSGPAVADAGDGSAGANDDPSPGPGASRTTTADGSSAADPTTTDEPEPPVDRGDEVTVDIEGIGDQGDGIARVDRGYVIIVPDTEKGERVSIRVTSVKQNVAFAEVTDRVERQQYE